MPVVRRKRRTRVWEVNLRRLEAISESVGGAGVSGGCAGEEREWRDTY